MRSKNWSGGASREEISASVGKGVRDVARRKRQLQQPMQTRFRARPRFPIFPWKTFSAVDDVTPVQWFKILLS